MLVLVTAHILMTLCAAGALYCTAAAVLAWRRVRRASAAREEAFARALVARERERDKALARELARKRVRTLDEVGALRAATVRLQRPAALREAEVLQRLRS